MRSSILLISVLLSCSTTHAQVLGWAWAWSAGGDADDRAVVDVSPSGALYLLGTYADTIDAHGVTLMSTGETDLFVQQLDPADGSVQWTAEAHNTADMEIFDIAYRSTGEIVVCGFVYHNGDPSSFGPHTIPGLASGNQAFIAGLSPTGSWNWVSTVPGPISSLGAMVEVDGNDDILLQCGYQRVWVYKFTGAGVPVWNTTASSDNGSLDGYAMDVLPDGGVVLTGRFHHTGTFGTIQLTDPTIYYDAFIAKLSSSGVWEWAVQCGGSHWDKGFGVEATPAGDVYVMGTFRNTATFGAFSYAAAGPNDLWVAKLSGAGDWLWVNPAGATAYMEVYGTDMATDGGRMVCAGTYSFAGTMLDGQTLPAPPSNFNELYIAEIDTLGNFISARGGGSTFSDAANGVAYAADGSIYAAGSFNEDMVLDNIDLDNVYGSDLWVGRLEPGLTTAVATAPDAIASLSLFFADDQLVVRNAMERAGTLQLFDALGRPLLTTRLTGAALQIIDPPARVRGLICWRSQLGDGSIDSGRLVR